MLEQEQIERLITESLGNRAGSIVPGDGSKERMRNKLICNYMVGGRRNILRHDRKIAVLLISCIVLLFGNITLASPFSPKSKSNILIPADIVENRLADITGSTVPSSDKKMTGIGFRRNDINLTLKEAEAVAGFKIILPEYLPKGYVKPDTFFVGTNYTDYTKGDPAKTGNKTVFACLCKGDAGEYKGAVLLITPDYIDDKKDRLPYSILKHEDRYLKYAQSEIMVDNDKEHGNAVRITAKYLYWNEGDLQYKLTDYTGLSQNELIKMIYSIKSQPD